MNIAELNEVDLDLNGVSKKEVLTVEKNEVKEEKKSFLKKFFFSDF